MDNLIKIEEEKPPEINYCDFCMKKSFEKPFGHCISCMILHKKELIFCEECYEFHLGCHIHNNTGFSQEFNTYVNHKDKQVMKQMIEDNLTDNSGLF